MRRGFMPMRGRASVLLVAIPRTAAHRALADRKNAGNQWENQFKLRSDSSKLTRCIHELILFALYPILQALCITSRRSDF